MQILNLPPSQPKQTSELRLDRIDGGVNYKYLESQLKDTQSPYMLNMNADDRGALVKRFGQEYTYDTSLGVGGILSAHERLYKSKKIFHHGTKLYSQVDNDQPVEIYSGLTAQKGVFFVFQDILYYLNGAEYVQWNGTIASVVTGYIPTITISTPPAGGGTLFEDFNLLSSGFKQSFSGDGTSTVYQLALALLDATTVTITVDGVAKVEGVDFTVNRTTGTITFTVAPTTGTNNVIITAYKTIAGYFDKVRKNKYAIAYGGANNTRIFIAGVDNIYRYCGVEDATYWPENSFNAIGSDEEDIFGFAKHYDTLVTFKERSIYGTLYSFDGTTVSFPTAPLNSNIGCDMPYSIQVIENNIVFFNTYAGGHILTRTDVDSQKNVFPLSTNINGSVYRDGILDETVSDLSNATSVSFGDKYYICVGSKVWVWDYRLSPYQGFDEELKWFYYENINANTWLVVDRVLYYGDRTNGLLVNFTEDYRDFDLSIPAVWKSKVWDFGLPDFLKTITQVWFKARSDTYTSITIRYFNDNGEQVDSQVITIASFSWASFAWDLFTWNVINFSQSVRRKPKIKKVVNFQIEFSNNEVGENLSILSLVIQYVLNRRVK